MLTSLGHCLDTPSNYGSGREPCTDKVFPLRLEVLSGFVFNAIHRGTLPLASVGRPNPPPGRSLRLASYLYKLDNKLDYVNKEKVTSPHQKEGKPTLSEPGDPSVGSLRLARITTIGLQ